MRMARRAATRDCAVSLPDFVVLLRSAEINMAQQVHNRESAAAVVVVGDRPLNVHFYLAFDFDDHDEINLGEDDFCKTDKLYLRTNR